MILWARAENSEGEVTLLAIMMPCLGFKCRAGHHFLVGIRARYCCRCHGYGLAIRRDGLDRLLLPSSGQSTRHRQ